MKTLRTTSTKALVTAATALLLCSVAAPLSAEEFDISTQIGPNPVLPEPQQYLFPPMKLAKVVGWTEV